MASLRTIRRRIRSVEKTKQITKAMRIVAATKFKKAEQRLKESRPYSDKLNSMLSNLSKVVGEYQHELLNPRSVQTQLLVVIGSDKGLCGSYNAGLIRKAEEFLKAPDHKIKKVVTVGKKMFMALQKRGYSIVKDYSDFGGKVQYDQIINIMQFLVQGFQFRSWDEVIILYSAFKSAVSNVPTLIPLLPIAWQDSSDSQDHVSIDYIFEPSPKEILDQLIPKLLNFKFFYYMAEALTSEHSARMVSMQNATENATDMIQRLTLVRNKVRQATITKEISEIVGGVEALKG